MSNAAPATRATARRDSATRREKILYRFQRLVSFASLILELGRVSNLPTCLTNVLVGYFWTLSLSNRSTGLSNLAFGALNLFGSTPWYPGHQLLAASLAVCLLYIAGMSMNDYVDRNIDAVERPGRPIPSGRLSAGQVLALTVTLFCAALGITGVWAPKSFGSVAGLALVIIAYNGLHHRWRASLVHQRMIVPLLMGCCRGMVIFVGADATLSGGHSVLPFAILREAATHADAASAGHQSLVFVALALTFWVSALTSIAQEETLHTLTRQTLARALLFAGLAFSSLVIAIFSGPFATAKLGASSVSGVERAMSCALATLIFLGWLYHLERRRKRTNPIPNLSQALARSTRPVSPFAIVMSLIASISLLDAVFLGAAVGIWGAALCVLGFLATRRLQRRIAGI